MKHGHMISVTAFAMELALVFGVVLIIILCCSSCCKKGDPSDDQNPGDPPIDKLLL